MINSDSLFTFDSFSRTAIPQFKDGRDAFLSLPPKYINSNCKRLPISIDKQRCGLGLIPEKNILVVKYLKPLSLLVVVPLCNQNIKWESSGFVMTTCRQLGWDTTGMGDRIPLGLVGELCLPLPPPPGPSCKVQNNLFRMANCYTIEGFCYSNGKVCLY